VLGKFGEVEFWMFELGSLMRFAIPGAQKRFKNLDHAKADPCHEKRDQAWCCAKGVSRLP
jgi:hypothetical protein